MASSRYNMAHQVSGPRGRLFFVIAAALSMLLHAAAVWAIHDRAITWLLPGESDREALAFRVQRAPSDFIIDDAARPPGEVEASAGEGEMDQMPLEDLSLALLDAAEPPSTTYLESEPATQLREVEESRPDVLASLAAAGLPELDLPPGLLSALPTLPAAHQGAFVPLPGEAPAEGGAGSGIGSAAARQMLAASGLVAINAPPSSLPRIRERDPIDARELDLPVSLPEIDFVDMALAGTTQLQMPESLDDDFEYQVTRFTDRDGANYFQVDITARRSLRKLRTLPKDVTFLVDTSGSVPQDYVRAVAEGLKDSLGSFNEGDRFNIVLFAESPRFFSTDGVMPATRENLDAAREFLDGARSAGWTDMNRALQQLLARDQEPDRVYYLILISDGWPTRGIQDTRQLINIITRDNDLAASIYGVGIGRRPNVELMEFLAYRNRAFCVFAYRQHEVAPAIRDLMSRLRYPIVKDMSLSVVGLGDEVYPTHLPNVHQGERFSIYGRYRDAGPFTLRVTGRSSGTPVDFTYMANLNDAPTGDRQIARAWGFRKLHNLYNQVIRDGETRELLREMDQLRRHFRLQTVYGQ